MKTQSETKWVRVLPDRNMLPSGRVRTVTAQHRDLCLVHYNGQWSALDNKCPHQGGPLGEGSIENGMLRCPWHGWDFDPCTGKAPGGFDDGVETFPVKVEGRAVYVGLQDEQPRKRTLSDVLMQSMVNWGIDTVFGMVGHSNLGLADALRQQEQSGNLRYFGIRHEGAASFAASAYAKLTGKPAACLAIAGPGATNLYTGLWDANVDRAPVLALTGQVSTQVLGTGAFQEVDLVRAFQSVAGFNHAVQADSDPGELMGLAVKHALLTRGVSHLTVPDNVAFSPAPETIKAGDPANRLASPAIAPQQEALEKAVALLREAKRPVIIAGHGARFHSDALLAFAERLRCPVITTFKAKGIVPDTHPLGCGVLGRSGTPIASWFMNESDLLVVFGASFSNHTGITPKKPIIQVDFDPLALSKFHAVEVPLWGEISRTLALLNEHLEPGYHTVDQRREIAERWDIWRREKARRRKETSDIGIGSARLFHILTQVIPANAVVAVDVGNNTYSFGRYFESAEQSVLMSGYLGSIGFALPAAMGAWAAVNGKRPVWSLSGDGGLGQYLAELTTLVQYGMDIKHVVLNNSELGKISKEQRAAELDVWKTNLHNPDFAAFAQNCGALGIRVEREEDLKEALQRLEHHNGPGLVEVITDAGLI